ncbi:diacylglycerol kinase family protein [Daejeonella sp.]|uniref:diacylglycerol/lipid kinase family protein n=1 Tax=Daejeonella sp. TaxID=2805397 RepID=UPI00271D1619|nr:diacylglycerol kinase family protein [Daejeonella sp.]MDO8991634.1 diacylglycerol kinase family lipid kinase [Daejeonella sp.]MDP2414179.1 diacylglycerol kinase family lipid kinase [Daejeonella sp.]
MKRKILFVINPISGGKAKYNFPKKIDKYLDKSKFDYECVFTDYHGHGSLLAVEAIRNGVDILVAVGGDGTINEVATEVEGTDKLMGIIPFGSGNGLARSLGIPIAEVQAIKRINNLHVSTIDSGTFNGRKFFNMAGIGFDAQISSRFAENVKRGLSSYIKIAFSEVSNYRSQHYRLTIDGKEYEHQAFMISVANSSQYGNNAHISPFASLNDGMLDICILKPFPLYKFPALVLRMFRKNTHKSNYLEIIQGSNITIKRESDAAVHLDGDPFNMGTILSIGVNPHSLNILN